MTVQMAEPRIGSREFFNELTRAMAEAIVIPNSWLPESYRQYKEFEVVDIMTDGQFDTEQVFGQSIADIERMHAEKTQPVIDLEYLKAEKARRVELYAKQYEETGEITYEPTIAEELAKLNDLLN